MRYLTLTAIVFFLGLLFAAPPKVVEEISGQVVGVTDGDTITVLFNKETIEVRLVGIDAPEFGQSYDTKAKHALSEMTLGRTVTVKKTGTDKYGRTLGIAIVGDLDANAKMVEDGWAWYYDRYNDEGRLSRLEIAARNAKRGLWADDTPIAPWDYRASQKTH